MFLASLSFLVTFAITRAITHASRDSADPLRIWVAGIHVHHLVPGILLLLLVGYLWLIQVGNGGDGSSVRLGRLTSMIYGAGAALTLDEFALWFRLEDVYWDRAGRASLDAVGIFGALVSAGLWGGPFLRGVGRQAARVLRRAPAVDAPDATPAPVAETPNR